MEVARSQGSKDCQPDMDVAKAWKEELKLLLKVKEESTINLKETSNSFRHWALRCGEPGKELQPIRKTASPTGPRRAHP